MNSLLTIPTALTITLISLGISLLLALFRLTKGPSIPDRVVAIDLITVILMAVVTLFLIGNNEPIFIDVIGALVLVSFLGTIAYAKHLEREISNE